MNDEPPFSHGIRIWLDRFPNAPFAPETVFNLLRDRVLKGNSALPAYGDPAIIRLVRVLNALWGKVRLGRGTWHEELSQREQMIHAIDLFTNVLPSHRDAYATLVNLLERWGIAEGIDDARADVVVLDALIAAARATQKRGLPLCINMFDAEALSTPSATGAMVGEFAHAVKIARDMLLPFKNVPRQSAAVESNHGDGAPVGTLPQRWMDIADDLRTEFKIALPGRPDEAAYRFINAVVPTITGENPTTDAIKTAFTKKRICK